MFKSQVLNGRESGNCQTDLLLPPQNLPLHGLWGNAETVYILTGATMETVQKLKLNMADTDFALWAVSFNNEPHRPDIIVSADVIDGTLEYYDVDGDGYVREPKTVKKITGKVVISKNPWPAPTPQIGKIVEPEVQEVEAPARMPRLGIHTDGPDGDLHHN